MSRAGQSPRTLSPGLAWILPLRVCSVPARRCFSMTGFSQHWYCFSRTCMTGLRAGETQVIYKCLCLKGVGLGSPQPPEPFPAACVRSGFSLQSPTVHAGSLGALGDSGVQLPGCAVTSWSLVQDSHSSQSPAGGCCPSAQGLINPLFGGQEGVSPGTLMVQSMGERGAFPCPQESGGRQRAQLSSLDL